MAPSLCVGVDVSENRGLDVVVVDAAGQLVGSPQRRYQPEDLGRLLGDLHPDVAVVAIDSPPAIGPEGASRACERALRARGIGVFSTPSDPARFAHPFYNWVRVGQATFEAAAAAGFELFAPETGLVGSAAEVYPHACDVILRGTAPPRGVTRRHSAKRQWRTETLRLAGFVEVDRLASLDAVDAALGALGACVALRHGYEALGEAPFFVVVPTPPPTGPVVKAGARPIP
jgi:predicted nuclease with RNAse H fold